MNDLVSIVVPCYNVAKWLDDLFKSLDAQTYKNFEVIFVDDGSKDETAKLLENYCKNHKNCRYITQVNQGVSVARNNGLKLAGGGFVCFVDPDDILSPNYISRLHELITSGDYDCAVCWLKKIDENQAYENISQIDVNLKKLEIKTYQDSQEIMTNYIRWVYEYSSLNKLYKTSLLKELPNFPNLFNKDIYIYEDFDFCYRVFSAVKNVITTNEILHYYRQRESSATHQKFNKKFLTDLLAFETNYDHCKENYPEAFKYLASKRICQTIGKLMLMKRNGFDSYEEIIPLINYLDKNYKQCLNKGMRFAYPLMRAVFFARTIRKHEKNNAK